MSATTTVWWNEYGRMSRIEVPSHPTPVPGLVINEHHSRPGVWVITHEPSGAAVLKITDPEAALYAATRLGEMEDWTLPGTVLCGRPVGREVRALARELDCYELTFESGGSVTKDMLREIEEAAS